MRRKKKEVDPFDKDYSLTHLSTKKTSHQISDLKPYDKNIELKVIVLEKKEDFVSKRSKTSICTFLVADQTGSMFANFYSHSEHIRTGDILYLNGAYTSLFKNKMILYEGKAGLKMKIGEFFFNFVEDKNISNENWDDYINNEINR